MKDVVSGGPTRAVACGQAAAGLPDTISLNGLVELSRDGRGVSLYVDQITG
jgi:hypothetical protein